MASKKILIVEDEKQLQNLLAIFLRPRGFELVTACDGREALEVLEDGIPDLVLLDIKLPVMDGFEFFRRICHHGNRPQNRGGPEGSPGTRCRRLYHQAVQSQPDPRDG